MNLASKYLNVVRLFPVTWIIFFVWALLIDSVFATTNSQAQRFNREVRPILSDNCYACHGPDIQKSEFQLNSKSHLLKGGRSGKVVDFDSPEKSEILTRIYSTDPDEIMPPPEAKKKLTLEERKVLKDWVMGGAEYAEHWAFSSPEIRELPDRSPWDRNPIDSFINQVLKEQQLLPSPEADRWTLGKRVSLDLTGLLPSYQDLKAFVNDDSNDAYEKFVESLLDSESYGERWARDWMDLARYADTNGYEKDRNRTIWPYRDWLIHAFNQNMPYDKFSIAQLAGDMLPNARQNDLIATGFHRNTMVNEEGGIDVGEFRYHAIVDRVKTTGAVWLGLTLSCAQCHNHKYDPISQKEYFEIFALFNNADEPELEVQSSDSLQKKKIIQAELDQLIAGRRTAYPAKEIDFKLSDLTVLKLDSKSSSSLSWNSETRSIEVRNPSENGDVYTLEAKLSDSSINKIKGIELQTRTGSFLPKNGPGYSSSGGNFILSEFEVIRKGKTSSQVEVVHAEADHSQDGYHISKSIDRNPGTGWAIWDVNGDTNKDRKARFLFKNSIELLDDEKLVIKLSQNQGGYHVIGHFKLSAIMEDEEALITQPEDVNSRLEKDLKAWIDEEKVRAVDWALIKPDQLDSERGATLTILDDLSVLASGDKPNKDVYSIYVSPGAGDWTGMRLEVLPHDSLPFRGPGRAHFFQDGDFFLSEVDVFKMESEKLIPIQLTAPFASKEKGGRSIKTTLDGKRDTGWQVGNRTGEYNQAVFSFTEPLSIKEGDRIKIVLDQHFIHQVTLGRFRLALTKERSVPIRATSIPHHANQILHQYRVSKSISEAHIRELEKVFLSRAPELKSHNARIKNLRNQLTPKVTTLVMKERSDKNARTTHMRDRGEYLRKLGPVEPGTPSILNWDPAISTPSNRLEFSQWLFQKNHPLTSRVFVNRTWSKFFGKGLVTTVEDFGLQGAYPTHPALLDWLAVQFQESSWDIKSLHKLIVMSATYRQTAARRPQYDRLDPTNIFYHRSDRIRLDAEVIRDNILQSAQLLSLKVGGPGVFPAQDASVTRLAYGSPSYRTSQGEDKYRRGMYTFWKRTSPYASFMAFDAPSADMVCTKRERSNTPLQSLILLNDTVYFEAAQKLSNHLITEFDSPSHLLIKSAYRRSLRRDPTSNELEKIQVFFDQTMKALRSSDSALSHQDIFKQTVLAFSRALLNTDEMIVRP